MCTIISSVNNNCSTSSSDAFTGTDFGSPLRSDGSHHEQQLRANTTRTFTHRWSKAAFTPLLALEELIGVTHRTRSTPILASISTPTHGWVAEFAIFLALARGALLALSALVNLGWPTCWCCLDILRLIFCVTLFLIAQQHRKRKAVIRIGERFWSVESRCHLFILVFVRAQCC